MAGPSKRQIEKAQASLLVWYAAHGRKDLPWRNIHDPYAIYVSEIMLQQTQVATVQARYYGPFLKQFPTLEALAKADLEAVLKMWEGLGYYSRARNLHKAAQQSGGVLPETVEGLLQLPGIGQNTAHAVAAFAFHQPVPVLEANVKRVVARVFAMEGPKDAQWWWAAAQLLNTEHPYDHNQAMMDVGAMICVPKVPKCDVCPLSGACLGKEAPERYPVRRVRKQTPTRRRFMACIKNDQGEIFLAPRKGRLLGGLYGFPQYEIWPEGWPVETLGNVKHQYSHFKLEGEVRAVDGNDIKGDEKKLPVDGSFHAAETMAQLPLSKVDIKVWECWKAYPDIASAN